MADSVIVRRGERAPLIQKVEEAAVSDRTLHGERWSKRGLSPPAVYTAPLRIFRRVCRAKLFLNFSDLLCILRV
jgi:hypothetical protein